MKEEMKGIANNLEGKVLVERELRNMIKGLEQGVREMREQV